MAFSGFGSHNGPAIPNPMYYILDEPGISTNGHLAMGIEVTARPTIPVDSQLRVKYGDWATGFGDWYQDANTANPNRSCPQTVILVDSSNVAGDATFLTYVNAYQSAVKDIVGGDPTALSFSSGTPPADSILSAIVSGLFGSAIGGALLISSLEVVGDSCPIRYAATPHGGITVGEVAAQADVNYGLHGHRPHQWDPLSPYQQIPWWGSKKEVTNTFPWYGSQNALTGRNSDIPVINGVYADTPLGETQGGVNASTIDTVIDPNQAYLGDPGFFPLFVVLDRVLNKYVPSIYQPHLLADGDGGAGIMLIRPGLSYPATGVISGDEKDGLHFISAYTQIGMAVDADGDAVVTTKVSSMTIPLTGCWGESDVNRPFHTAAFELSDTLGGFHSDHPKTKGEGRVSLTNLGPDYTNIPITPADWWVTGFHANMANDDYWLSSFSLGVGVDSVTNTIEKTILQQPFLILQWQDVGGTGFEISSLAPDPDLKGYRFLLPLDDSVPLKAPVDAVGALGGTYMPIMKMDMTNGSTDLWVHIIDDFGITTRSGRLTVDGIYPFFATDHPGALFVSGPGSALLNVSLDWMGHENDVIPRLGVDFVST